MTCVPVPEAMLTVGSLFTGIGGFDLGLERAGMRVLWQSEVDGFCQRVLARHWPGVLLVPDVRSVGANTVPAVDVLCGGVPCQPISVAGKGLGEADERWLWPDTLRVVGELRPRYVLLENPAAFIGRGLLGVLGELAALGYDAEWSVVSAADVGAPHLRERVWIIAYPDSDELRKQPGWRSGPRGSSASLVGVDGEARPLAYPDGEGQPQPEGRELHERGRVGDGGEPLADSDSLAGNGPGAAGEPLQEPGEVKRPGRRSGVRGELQDANGGSLRSWRVGGRAAQAGGSEWWAVEPPVGRVAHGVPDRLDQLAALGNALVPQIAQWIGERIVAYERSLEVAA